MTITVRYGFPGSRIELELPVASIGFSSLQLRHIDEGIWVGPDKINSLPTSGAAWDVVYADASKDWGVGNIMNQDSNHDVWTMAGALVAARTGEFLDKTRQSLMSIIGTEFNPQDGSDWLAISRNMGAYTVAADIIGLRRDGDPESDGSVFHDWMEDWLTKEFVALGAPRSISGFDSGSNASAQEGFFHAALAAYLEDADELQVIWEKYQRFVGDPSGPLDPHGINLSQGVEANWAHDLDNPIAINPLGTTKVVPAGLPGAGLVKRIDGAVINDIRRGGAFQWPPGYTNYVWTGIDGLMPCALILHRAGLPAFEVADQAILRSLDYLWYLRTETGVVDWLSGNRSHVTIDIVNKYYGTAYPMNGPVPGNRCAGYTTWSHPQIK